MTPSDVAIVRQTSRTIEQASRQISRDDKLTHVLSPRSRHVNGQLDTSLEGTASACITPHTPRTIRTRTEVDQTKPNRFKIVPLNSDGRPLSVPTYAPNVAESSFDSETSRFHSARNLYVPASGIPMRRNSSTPVEEGFRHFAPEHTFSSRWGDDNTATIGYSETNVNKDTCTRTGSDPIVRSAPQSPWMVRDGRSAGRFTVTALDTKVSADDLYDRSGLRSNQSAPQRRLNSVDSVHESLKGSCLPRPPTNTNQVTYGRSASISGGCASGVVRAHADTCSSISPESRDTIPIKLQRSKLVPDTEANTISEGIKQPQHPHRGRLHQHMPPPLVVNKDLPTGRAGHTKADGPRHPSTPTCVSGAVRKMPANTKRTSRGNAQAPTQMVTNTETSTSVDFDEMAHAGASAPANQSFPSKRMSLPIAITEEVVVSTPHVVGLSGLPEGNTSAQDDGATYGTRTANVAVPSQTDTLMREMLDVIKEQRQEMRDVSASVLALQAQMQMQADVANARIDALQEVCQQQSALLRQLAREHKGANDDDVCVQSMMNAIVTQGFDIDCLRAENKILRSAKCV
ncbi:hypothetical protein SARC_01842 [Sphaeroforma arctica JP610]|uniref:Uncharacterized protein n=1 Tax=Sphaeroforma arctica JP610 TaxID=667725 RepID=A0A0L0GAD9_9EUKA|nr:hypothetical protein SARC_01842 [Sphaeroforma arctica JP610]KNC85997.1 hypothetical protein SARC_01842 [Sphaeroforma arctica JP610]|eukprot:XP_014159899.1 hypothetical protein SARC_01842 [Sphaeroforma arctica JP610]